MRTSRHNHRSRSARSAATAECAIGKRATGAFQHDRDGSCEAAPAATATASLRSRSIPRGINARCLSPVYSSGQPSRSGHDENLVIVDARKAGCRAMSSSTRHQRMGEPSVEASMTKASPDASRPCREQHAPGGPRASTAQPRCSTPPARWFTATGSRPPMVRFDPRALPFS
jgi:hypothetical protein